MQATETSIGSEPRLEVPDRRKENREMQDVLSRCLPSFYRKAYRHLGNAADAEDAVQDALLSAYKHLDQFKGQSQMSTWLTTIVINCARMHLRNGHARLTFRSMSDSGKTRNIPWPSDWRTGDQVLKRSAGIPNWTGACCNSRSSFRLHCAKHSSCANWMA